MPGREIATAGVPMYKRLPHGPHRIPRSEVVRHQRLRIHGAMVEVVSDVGYQSTSVKRVIALAGVSRRSFYEQFANKQECFLATFDVIAQRHIERLDAACREADGNREQHLRAALTALAAAAHGDRKALAFVLVEAPTAGASGTLRLRRAIGAGEQLLARALGGARGVEALPAPVVGAIAGGLHGALSAALREPAAIAPTELGEELLSWARPFADPARDELGERLAREFTRRVRERSRASAHRAPAEQAVGDAHERVLRSALRIAVRDGHAQLSPAQIADEADVSLERMMALFGGSQACFLAALDTITADLLALTEDEGLGSSDWARAVRRVVAKLMGYLGDHPLQTRAIAQEALRAGPEACTRERALMSAIAARLTAGAPSSACSGVTLEAIAGAFSHAVRCQVAGGRIPLLPALADYLSYAILTPFIGAGAAAAIVTEPAG